MFDVFVFSCYLYVLCSRVNLLVVVYVLFRGLWLFCIVISSYLYFVRFVFLFILVYVLCICVICMFIVCVQLIGLAFIHYCLALVIRKFMFICYDVCVYRLR